MFAKLLNAFKKKNTNAPAAHSAAKTAAKSTAKAAVSQPAATPAVPKGPSSRELAEQQLNQLTHGQPIAQINDIETLSQLVKLSSQLDKKTNRDVRERLHQLKDQQKQVQADTAQQLRICERLETLSRLNHHPLFDSEFNHLREQWQQFTDHNADVAERVAQAILRCVAIQRDAEQIAQQAAEQAAAKAKTATVILSASPEAAPNGSTDNAQAELPDNQVAEEGIEASTSEEATAAQTAPAKAAVKKAQISPEEQRAQEQAQQQLLSKAQTQLAQLESAIEQADGKKARDIQDRLRASLKQLDRKHASQIDGKLHLLSGQLRDLIDWQAFAALPKLEAMCDEMEKLADTELPPAAKADAVRELQNQWRAAKPPQVKQAQALWDRFKVASDRAWAPCAEHFDAEKTKREFNLQQREVICASLEQFAAQFNAETADWKALAQLLEQAHQEFRRFFPVPRNADKDIQQRYELAIAPLKDALREQHKANETVKQQLIEKAQALSNSTDAPDLVDRVKQLQESWKQVGATRRHEDQKLWLQFKAATDSLFEMRRSGREQAREQNDIRAGEANQVIAALQQLAASDDATLNDSAEAYAELEARFDAFNDLPEALFAALQKKFRQHQASYRERVQGIPARREQQQVTALWARATNPAATEPALPEALEKVITERSAAIAAGEHAAADALQDRQLLAIELEVLADLASPDEARELRQKWQMTQLTQGGIGHNDPAARATRAQALFQRFCTELPAQSAVETGLQVRVEQALTALKILR